jgi:Fe-S cluster biogenesis protein NfuA
MEIAQKLVQQFERMVRRDGGALSVLSVDENLIRIGYRLGGDPACADGACVLPHVELQELMGETLARYDRSMRVVVEVVPSNSDSVEV